MPKKEMFLIRKPDGRMATVIAGSTRGALKKFLADSKRKNKKVCEGDYDVRERLSSDEWARYYVR